MKCKLCCIFNSNVNLYGLLKVASEIGLNCIFSVFTSKECMSANIDVFVNQVSKISCLRRFQTGNIYILGTFQAEFSVSQSD